MMPRTALLIGGNEVEVVQQSDDLETLMAEAEEVQKRMKSIIWPENAGIRDESGYIQPNLLQKKAGEGLSAMVKSQIRRYNRGLTRYLRGIPDLPGLTVPRMSPMSHREVVE